MTEVLDHQTSLPRATDEQAHCHLAPTVRTVLRRLGTNLLVACIVPGIVFTSLTLGVGITAALLGTLFWSYSAIGWQVCNGRRLSGLLLITSSVLTLRTLVALASGDTFLYFLQPVATDALIGMAFFVSLLTARPVVARVAGDFYPLTPEVASRRAVTRLLPGPDTSLGHRVHDQGDRHVLVAADAVGRHVRGREERVRPHDEHDHHRTHDRRRARRGTP